MINIVTILLLFATLVAYEYIRDLRRALKNERACTRSALMAYENTYHELCALKGVQAPPRELTHDPETDEPKRRRDHNGFRPGAVGLTAILHREASEGRIDDTLRRPGSATPSPEAIAAAIREAENNGELN